MNVKELTVDVKAKITVDRKTAEACLKLVEMYVNETHNYIQCDRTGSDISFYFVEGSADA